MGINLRLFEASSFIFLFGLKLQLSILELQQAPQDWRLATVDASPFSLFS